MKFVCHYKEDDFYHEYLIRIYIYNGIFFVLLLFPHIYFMDLCSLIFVSWIFVLYRDSFFL